MNPLTTGDRSQGCPRVRLKSTISCRKVTVSELAAVRLIRRMFLKLIPMALTARVLNAQGRGTTYPNPYGKNAPLYPSSQPPPGSDASQRDVILKRDYQANLEDTNDLIGLANSFKLALEKTDPLVLSRDLLKKWDDIEKVAKRIHNRLHR